MAPLCVDIQAIFVKKKLITKVHINKLRNYVI